MRVIFFSRKKLVKNIIIQLFFKKRNKILKNKLLQIKISANLSYNKSYIYF